ncbi:MAG: enoyl-CoA hydratase/isomerase family protein [Desulfobulbus sp.]|uniref:enoyl-CoA hydratase/isomerase family protein n=1 Tax=Desulfobulbus sp. TaxID=895 RepID=UPI0028464C9E|nr:enoyl-CoA hydratase-related protein [Desulfobulbus sp.]MDR2548764.1 enoyl-CoA hydratase/isomerase family protein [Desulfobulbus sp.]
MVYTSIELTCGAGIATLTFNRPKALNALNTILLEEFADALEGIKKDESIRVLILTGSGEKAFVAGADITEIATLTPLGAKKFAQRGQDVIGRLQALAIPAIAAVNGYALGGGCEMALACDFIYASDKAIFGLPEISLGVIPGFGGTQRLPRLIGANRAKEMIFTGKHLTAVEAKEIGLVNKIFAPEELMAAANETAQLIAGKGKASLCAAKQTLNQGLNADLATGLAIERDAFALCLASQDAKEGTGAFLEKRKPVFTGGLND